MANAARQMRLTAEHVRRAHRDIADPGPGAFRDPNFRAATDDDYAEQVSGMLATRPSGPFWLFGISSLIWRPETASVDKRTATLSGWHRHFCLGWDYRFRGTRETPGLMMALDEGGECTGVAYQLPEEGLEAELHKLIRREMSMVPTAFPWRWVDLETDQGPLRSLTFAMNRKSSRYISTLGEDEMVTMLATACGFRGSMCDYLFQTVSALEAHGIHDAQLWRLQELVADKVDAMHGTEN